CPPSASYRFRKFARRNKPALVSAVLIALALLAGIVVSTWQALRATHASHEAEVAREGESSLRIRAEANEKTAKAEAAKSKQVADFLKDMFGGSTPWSAHGQDTALLRQIMDRAAQRIATGLTEYPEVEAELRSVLGRTYWSIAEYQKSLAMHRRALEIYRQLLGSDSLTVAKSVREMALPLRELKGSEAEQALREALAIYRQHEGTDLEIAGILRDIGLLIRGKDLPQAILVEREALTIRRRLSPDSDDV